MCPALPPHHGSACRPCRLPCLLLISAQVRASTFSCMEVSQAWSSGDSSIICSENSARTSPSANCLMVLTRTDRRSEMVLFAMPKARARAEVLSPWTRRWQTASHCPEFNFEGLPRLRGIASPDGILTSSIPPGAPSRCALSPGATLGSSSAPCRHSGMKQLCLPQSSARCSASTASSVEWPRLASPCVPVSSRSAS